MISVIIPTYNRARFLDRAIKSILEQSLKAHEIIVVDDGSDDKTDLVLNKYKDSIKVIKQSNKGVSFARNIGIKSSSAEWIALLDSDDEWLKDKLKIQYEFHQKNRHLLFSHTKERWVKNSKIVNQKSKHQKPEGYCFRDNLEFCKISPSTVMIHRSIFESVGYFDEDLKVCEDYDLWLRILREFELGLINKELTIKHAHPYNQLSFTTPLMDLYRVKALLKHKKDPSAKKVLKKKIDILKNGAKKHNNRSILDFLDSIET